MLVLSVSFSPARRSLLHDMKDSGEERTHEHGFGAGDGGEGIQEECEPRKSRQMSGGEYTTFMGDKRFEPRVMDEAARAQPVPDYVQAVGSDAGVAYDAREDGGGLWGADCGAGELLALNTPMRSESGIVTLPAGDVVRDLRIEK